VSGDFIIPTVLFLISNELICVLETSSAKNKAIYFSISFSHYLVQCNHMVETGHVFTMIVRFQFLVLKQIVFGFFLPNLNKHYLIPSCGLFLSILISELTFHAH
ncbi:hypothetical protein V8G54_015340, partial [Vigna mungo]